MRLRVVIAGRRDDVLAAAQQPADLVVEDLVRHLQPRSVDHYVGRRRQDRLDVAGGEHADLGPTGDRAGVLPVLAIAVDVQADQLIARRVEHRAQAGLADRAGGPLDDPIGHRPRPVEGGVVERMTLAIPRSQRTGSSAYLARASIAIRSVSKIRSPRTIAARPVTAMSRGSSFQPSTWSAIRVSTEPTIRAVTLVSCSSSSARAMIDRNSVADFAGE